MRRRLVIGFVPAMLAAAQCPAGQTAYRLVDLGTLTNRSSHGFGINNLAHVVGWSTISGQPGTPHQPAIPFINHAYVYTSNPMTDLGAFPSGACSPYGCESVANDISDSGLVIGWSATPFQIPFIWSAQATPILSAGLNPLPALFAGNTNSEARAINESMQIAGESRGPGGVPIRAVRWHHDGAQWVVSDLGTLQPGGTGTSGAYGINELGQVVGTANAPGGGLHAFLHLPAPAYGLPQGMNDLTPAASSATALDINDSGQVIGVLGGTQGWIWLPQPALGFSAGFSMLPTFNGSVVYPSAINNAGQVVGTAFIQQGQNVINRGVLLENGVWKALNTLLPANSPWDIRNFALQADINDAGVITGDMRSTTILDANGAPAIHAFRLAPIVAGDVNGDALVDVGDLLEVINAWGPCPDPPRECLADLDGDLDVNVVDLLIVISSWSK